MGLRESLHRTAAHDGTDRSGLIEARQQAAVLKSISPQIRQYLIVTGNYWAFTLTDGALRMLVVLFFYDLGYAPLEIALLFLFYEVFGMITNLLGGWLGAHLGLNKTMNIGLLLQIVALSMLLVPQAWLTVMWVMAAQALSGIAKDLNKMSAKTSVKLLVPDNVPGRLYHWVAVLTGSKNALKGFGFFLGGLLLTVLGFRAAVAVMAAALTLVWIFSLLNLKKDLGKAKTKPRFSDILSKSRAINILSAARLFLFGARDVWFVVALPVYLSSVLGWDHWSVGGFLAIWIIGYGLIQALAPKITGNSPTSPPIPKDTSRWTLTLAIVPLLIYLGMSYSGYTQTVLLSGLILFAFLFAINSSLHSYLIVSFARADGASLDVGFYYMANAGGRLLGTVLSGWLYQVSGLGVCLLVSTGFIALAAAFSLALPGHSPSSPRDRIGN
jgi:MFS family permease